MRGPRAAAPLTPEDVTALASTLRRGSVPCSGVVFDADKGGGGVWIVRSGQMELSTGSGRSRVVVSILPSTVTSSCCWTCPCPTPAARSRTSSCSDLGRGDFERLLATHPGIARHWLSSVAQRLNSSHMRILGLLGRSLSQQTAQLPLDEAGDDTVAPPQRRS